MYKVFRFGYLVLHLATLTGYWLVTRNVTRSEYIETLLTFEFLTILVMSFVTAFFIFSLIRVPWIFYKKITSGSRAQRAGLERVYDKGESENCSEKARKDIETLIKHKPRADIHFISSTGFRASVEPDGILYNLFNNPAIKFHISVMDPSLDNFAALQNRAQQVNMEVETFRKNIIKLLEAAALRSGSTQVSLYRGQPCWKIIMIDHCCWVQNYVSEGKVQLSTMYKFKHVPRNNWLTRFFRLRKNSKKKYCLYDYFSNEVDTHFLAGGRSRQINLAEWRIPSDLDYNSNVFENCSRQRKEYYVRREEDRQDENNFRKLSRRIDFEVVE